jgi:hypothetical protein
MYHLQCQQDGERRCKQWWGRNEDQQSEGILEDDHYQAR